MALLLFCILASAVSESAECFSSPMSQKGNPVMSLPPCGEEELDSLMSVKVQAPFGARVQKVQKVQRVVVGAFGAIIYAACGGENRTTALRAWKCIPPLVAGATTFPPHWEACHWILSRLRLLANPVPLPPQAGAL